jgi:hypothetical protein
MDELKNWHALFGLILTDFFAGSPFVVETEKDLSLKAQFLDVVIVRRLPGPVSLRLPDGMEELAEHNLITFKSLQEALDDWALKELTGHYVNYRKQVSPSTKDLLPEEQFRLFAVCARYPHNLASAADWTELGKGVYRCRRGTDEFRVVVMGDLPQQEHNAMLHLFSAKKALLSYGMEHWQQRCPEMSTRILQLIAGWEKEGVKMPEALEDFKREYLDRYLKSLPPEKRLEGLPPEERLKGLLPKERMKGLTPGERLEGLSPEDVLKGLSPEEIAKLRELLRSNESGSEPSGRE